MKTKLTMIRSLFMGLWICAGISACSDDAIRGDQTEVQGTATPAYLTISFSTNTSAVGRSTADEGANNGDTDGNPEDSGHHNTGTTEENTIDKVLVVACPDGGNVGFAKLYTNSDKTNIPSSANSDFWVYQNTLGTATTTDNPIQLAVGKYKIMVVVNPVGGLLKQGFTSTSDVAEVRDLYRKIQDEAYEPGKTIYTTKYLSGSSEESGFMMSNREEYSVELNEGNTLDNPLIPDSPVYVERTLSKITYRAGGLDADNNPTTDNKYAVKIETTAEPVIRYGAVKLSDDAKFTKKPFNKATDKAGKVVYALYLSENGKKVFEGAYKQQTDKTETVDGESLAVYERLTATTDATQTGDYYLVDDANKPEASLTLAQDVTASETFYITLRGFALVNLSQKVNYVRHTVYESNNLGDPFGVLNGKNFLWTPYWAEKNGIEFDAKGEVAESSKSNWEADTWFFNTLENVSKESKTLTIAGENGKDVFYVNGGTEKAVYYKPMSELQDISNQAVTGGGTQHPENNLPDVGKLMGYCLENSTDIEHQTHALSTGISFVATVAKADGSAVKALYKYGGHTYVTLEAIQKAYGSGHFEEGFQTLVDKEVADKDAVFTKEELMKFGIVKYESNVCYYFTNEIKHFDNGNNAVMGNMEFAIMRNNIYSLSVTHIDAVGDPYVDPTPGIVDETGQAALKLQAEILPWVVRYNNIEF